MVDVHPQFPDITFGRLDSRDSISELTTLLHRAYAGLADLGLRYMATHQSDEMTAQRVAQGECYVARRAGKVIGTIMFKPAEKCSGSPWLDRPEVSCLAQFGVDPAEQGTGLGAMLLSMVEQRAQETGAREIALDTAEPAHHLVRWYTRCGYRLIETMQWSHTNYRSVVMSKTIA